MKTSYLFFVVALLLAACGTQPMPTIAVTTPTLKPPKVSTTIPVVVTNAISPQPTVSPSNTPTPVPSATKMVVTYKVVAGDTLFHISQVYGVSVEAIKTANGLTSNLIYVNQVLIIPSTSVQVVATNRPNNPTINSPTAVVPPIIVPKPSFVTNGKIVYGVHVLDPVNSSGLAMSMGVKLIKVQIRWAQIQTCGQEPNWGSVQSQVDAIRTAGGQALLSVVTTPPCLNVAGQENFPPDDLQKYAEFVGGLASRFKPYAIEVWNEENLSREWNGPDPTKYIAMLKLAYSSIKTNSPTTLVIAGALSPTWHNPPDHWDDLVYWQEFGKQGGSAYADCVGVHINSLSYGPSLSLKNPVKDKEHHSWYFPDTLLGSTSATGLPACITELGIPTPKSVGGIPNNFSWGANTTLEQQAAWLVEGMKLAEAYGNVKILVFWNLDFSPACGGCVDEKSIYSLLDKNARALPAYSAIKSALGR